MCGRTVCNLNCDTVQRKCAFVNDKGKKIIPTFKKGYNGQLATQSYNISPGQLGYVLYCEKPTYETEFLSSRVIQPMRWGLIPSWFKDQLETFKLSTHNAKLETVLEKPSFKSSLKNGNRGVVIIEGFYEWTSGKKKQPYFIKLLNDEAPMCLAVIFDVLKTRDDNLPSYTILTEISKGKIATVHHRAPVILHDFEEIEMWLDSKDISAEKAILQLQERKWNDDELDVYPVSDLVNKSSFNDPKCVLKLEKFVKKTDKDTVLTQWLRNASVKKESKAEKSIEKMENI